MKSIDLLTKDEEVEISKLIEEGRRGILTNLFSIEKLFHILMISSKSCWGWRIDRSVFSHRGSKDIIRTFPKEKNTEVEISLC